MQQIRMFISSPGDVGREREITARVVERLQAELSGVVRLTPYFWEHEPMRAHTDFQSQIEPPSKFDVFVCVLWSRLGTRLHPGVHRRADGTPYASGTEFEFEDALRSLKASKAPEMLVYRRRSQPMPPLEPEEKVREFFQQYSAMKLFWERWTKDDSVGALKAAFNPYEDLSDFEVKLERHLRRVIEDRLPVGAMTARPDATWVDGSPFRGLAAFEFEHYPIFRGRTRAIDEVLTQMREQALAGKAFLLIFGGSGVGKSSLARAGILPMLVQPGVMEGIGLWRRVVITPAERREGDLCDLLAAALLRPEGLPELTADGTTGIQLAAMLRKTPDSASLLIKGGLSLSATQVMHQEKLERPPVARLVLLVDQMEELFTLTTIPEEERAAFFHMLSALAGCGWVWVVATLRSDFYPRCEAYPQLMSLKDRGGEYHLRAPSQAEIGQMIRLPAAAAGLHFEENRQTGERLDDLLRDEAMANPAALPLMEFALEELYKRQDKEKHLLTLSSYEEIGRLQGALGRRAEEVYGALSSTAQQSLDWVLRHLVSASTGETSAFVRRPASRALLLKRDGAEELVHRFIEGRLFLADRDASREGDGNMEGGAVTVTLVHEALMHHWPRMQAWLEDNLEFLLARGRVNTAAARWMAEGRHHDLLLPPGRPLTEGAELLQTRRDELPTEVIDFVETSIKRDRSRRRKRTLLAAGLAALITASAFMAWQYAEGREHTRIENLKIQFERDFNQAELDYLKVSALDLKQGTSKVRELARRHGDLIQLSRSMMTRPDEPADRWQHRIYVLLEREVALHLAAQDLSRAKELEEELEIFKRTLPAKMVEQGAGLSEVTQDLIGSANAANAAIHAALAADLQMELIQANEHLKPLLKQNEMLKQALEQRLRGKSGTPPPSTPPPAPKPVEPAEPPSGSRAPDVPSQLEHALRNRVIWQEFILKKWPRSQTIRDLPGTYMDLAEHLAGRKERTDAQKLETLKCIAKAEDLIHQHFLDNQVDPDEALKKVRTTESQEILPYALGDLTVLWHKTLLRKAKVLDQLEDAAAATAAMQKSVDVLELMPRGTRNKSYTDMRFDAQLEMAKRLHGGKAPTKESANHLNEVVDSSIKRDAETLRDAKFSAFDRMLKAADAWMTMDDRSKATEHFKQALEFAEREHLRDESAAWNNLAILHGRLSSLASSRNEPDAAYAHLKETVKFRKLGLKSDSESPAAKNLLVNALHLAAWMANRSGHPDEARAMAEEGITLAGERSRIGWLKLNLMYAHLYEHRLSEAEGILREWHAEKLGGSDTFAAAMRSDFGYLAINGRPVPDAERMIKLAEELKNPVPVDQPKPVSAKQ